MGTFLLVVCVITAAIQSPLKKIYQNKTGKGVFLFSAMISFVAALFFGVGSLVGGDVSFELALLPYSVGFAVCYGVCIITGVLALGLGSLALTSLFASYSLIFPTLYGLLFWDNPVFLSQAIGLVFLLVSLYLTNMGNKKKGDEGEAVQEKKGFSLKWLVCVILMAVSNGGCAILQQEQQRQFEGAYKNEFMFVALMIVVVALLVVVLLRERKDAGECLRLGAVPAVLTGLCNGLTNLLVMVIANVMIPAFIFFPIVSAGGLVISYVLSVTCFKERFSTTQKVGILLGLVALVLLNLEFVKIFR